MTAIKIHGEDVQFEEDVRGINQPEGNGEIPSEICSISFCFLHLRPKHPNFGSLCYLMRDGSGDADGRSPIGDIQAFQGSHPLGNYLSENVYPSG